MTGLGLVVTWVGYLLFVFGYGQIKGSTLGLTDYALPSHRSTYIAAGRLHGK